MCLPLFSLQEILKSPLICLIIKNIQDGRNILTLIKMKGGMEHNLIDITFYNTSTILYKYNITSLLKLPTAEKIQFSWANASC